MPTRVRSFAKINLGLAIGPLRADGFHQLTTLYQTLEAHDWVTVSAEALPPGEPSRIVLCSNDPRVPLDRSNTVAKMLEQVLVLEPFCSRGWVVRVEIDKRLPVQGGLGAGSANAAAALLGLEREVGLALSGPERLKIAAAVGSDVPLFLIGGSVLGLGRGEQVYPMPDAAGPAPSAQVPGSSPSRPPTSSTPSPGLLSPGSPIVVLALPRIGVSTPQAFRDWDARVADAQPQSPDPDSCPPPGPGTPAASSSRTPRPAAALTQASSSGRLEVLSRALAAALCEPQTSSGVFPENSQEDLAGHTLSALVRTGIRNDFEEVVFRLHPFLGTIKRALLGFDGDLAGKSASATGALYAALAGSGSALFGLYGDDHAASAAETRLHLLSVATMRTRLLSRAAYWAQVFERNS